MRKEIVGLKNSLTQMVTDVFHQRFLSDQNYDDFTRGYVAAISQVNMALTSLLQEENSEEEQD